MYSGLSNEELVILCQENKNKEVMEELLNKNIGLIKMAVKKFVSYKTPFEDMYQEAVIAFIENIHKYDESKGSKFSSYIYPWMVSKLQKRFVKMYYTVNLANNIYYDKKQENNKYISVSLNKTSDSLSKYGEGGEFIDILVEKSDPVSDILNNIYFNSLLEMDNISESYKKMFKEYFGIGCNSKNSKEIAAEYGCSHQYITQCLKRVIMVIRKKYGITDTKIILSGAY